MGRRVVVRIIGLASTTKGFAYAVTENSKRLVSWGLLRLSSRRVPMALEKLFRKSRPLFVAFDATASDKKRVRGKFFKVIVEKSCDLHGLMILSSQARHAIDLGRQGVSATKWRIASELSKIFRELEHKLPNRRQEWTSEDDRMGIFMALATAVAAWRNFAEGVPPV